MLNQNTLIKANQVLIEKDYYKNSLLSDNDILSVSNNVFFSEAIKLFQRDNFDKLKISNNHIDFGIATPQTLELLFTDIKNLKYCNLSKYAIDMILAHEISGESYYNMKLQSPVWPGGASGVTIGIGYDLGYNSISNLKTDFGNYISPNDISMLSGVVGLKAGNAQRALSKVKSVKIPFTVAYRVFIENSIPKYLNTAIKTYPSLINQTPDFIGGILSLVYNRGNSTTGATRVEMRNIQKLMADNSGSTLSQSTISHIANEIKKMKRLWVGKGLDGLLGRRDDEHNLILNSTRVYSDSELVKIYY